MENQERKGSQTDGNDVDMGVLINLFVRMARKVIAFFANLFSLIGSLLLWVFFFLRKNLIWIGIAIIIGLFWGIYADYKHGSKYESKMIVRTNFGSTRALYNTLDYMNALIGDGKIKDLAQVLSISETDALKLRSFQAEPVEDELALVDLYKQKFLIQKRNDLIRLDTFWSRVYNYQDFKKNLTRYDQPLHQVTVISIAPDIFAKIQPGIIHQVVENDVLKKIQDLNLQSQKEEEDIVLSSIRGLDTLRLVYNQRLQKQTESKDGGTTNLNLLDKELNIKTPELDLYDKLLTLKDELSAVRRNSAETQSIIQIYSGFSPVGQRMNVLKQDSAGYAIKSVILVLLLLMVIEIYKAGGKYEDRGLKN